VGDFPKFSKHVIRSFGQRGFKTASAILIARKVEKLTKISLAAILNIVKVAVDNGGK
jgi:hypothetical protein